MIAKMMISIPLCLALALSVASTAAASRVLTTSGALLGSHDNGVGQYLGVPYASKPVRFSPAQLISATPENRDATTYGATCMQPPHLKEVMSPLLDVDQNEISEDCLNLNVYVPEDMSRSPFPVLVWIPGEGFDYANANQFDGSYMARQGGVMVITVNYRVSVFGFLSALSDDAPGNIGFLDQQLALQWIRLNAAAFGGDPERITVIGRFTGAMSISAQLTSPRNRKVPRLFARAILQSGIASGPWVMDDQPLATLEETAIAAGCPRDDPLPCLRRMPASELLQKSQTVSRRYRPILDGQFLVEDPMESFRHGRVMDADVILGSNSDEGSLCLLSLYYLNSTFYHKVVNDQLSLSDFGDLVSSALEDFTKRPAEDLVRHLAVHEYGRQKGGVSSLRDSYVNFCGAMYVIAQVEQVARYLSKTPGQRVYVYEFDHRPSFSIQPKFLRGGAHGDDVLFALGLLQRLKETVPDQEKQLSKMLVESISTFANNGIPSFRSSRSSIQWPRYSAEERKVLHLTLNPSIRPSTHDADVSFWQSVVPSVTSSSSRTCFSTADATSNNTVGYIVGNLVTLQTTEYVLLTLACLTLLLVTTIAAAPHIIHKTSTHSRKDSMLADLVY